MITISKLISNLQQCRDTNISLPSDITNDDSKFIQKTALSIRKEELENINCPITHITPANYTMDTQIKETTVNIKEMNNAYVNNKYKQNNNDIIIPSKSLIVYIENETSQIPEILLDIFKIANIHSNDWYI